MTRQCKHQACTTRASFGVSGSPPEFCAQHCLTGMIDVRRKRCRATHNCCSRVATYGYNTAEFCAEHAKDDMVNIRHKTCAQHDCTTRPSFAEPGDRAKFCSKHARVGMVNVCSKSCAHQGCTVRPSFGQVGSTKAEFCLEHATDGMVDVVSRRCAHPDCSKQPSFGTKGQKVEYCSGHATPGMVNVVTKRCAHPDCTKQPSFFVPGSTKVELCLTHAKDRTLRSKAGHAREESARFIVDQSQRGHELDLESTAPIPSSRTDGKRKKPVGAAAQKARSPVRGSSSTAREFEPGHRAVVQPPPPPPPVRHRLAVVQQSPLPALRAVLAQGTSTTTSPATPPVPQRSHFLVHPELPEVDDDLAGKSLPAHCPHGVLSCALKSTEAGGTVERGWKPVFRPLESTVANGDLGEAARWMPVFESQQRRSRGGEVGGSSDDYRAVAVPQGFELETTREGIIRVQGSGAVGDPRRGAFVPGAIGRSAWRPAFGTPGSLDIAGGEHEAGGNRGPEAMGTTGNQEEEHCPYETFQQFKARRSRRSSSTSGNSGGGSMREKNGGRAHEGLFDPSGCGAECSGGIKVKQDILRQLQEDEWLQQQQQQQQQMKYRPRPYEVHETSKRFRPTEQY